MLCSENTFLWKSKTFSSNHEFKPYITPDLEDLIKEKTKLARKYAKRPITYGERFRRLRNKVTLAIRTAKANYNKARLEQNSGNSKKTWNIINSVLHRKTNNNLSNIYVNNNTELRAPHDIANQFNSYFINIGAQLADNTEESDHSFASYIQCSPQTTFSMTPITE